MESDWFVSNWYLIDWQLVAVLREVHFIERRGRSEEIPESAAKIYEKNDTFRDYINNLDLTVKWYNKVGIWTISNWNENTITSK